MEDKELSGQPTETQPTSTVSDAPAHIWITRSLARSLYAATETQNDMEYIAKSEDKLVEALKRIKRTPDHLGSAFVNDLIVGIARNALAEYNKRITK